jgi:hypothetical protein
MSPFAYNPQQDQLYSIILTSVKCAVVNFVPGTGEAGGSAGCKNGTGVTVSYVTDAILSNLSTNSSSATAASSSTSSGSSASTSTSKAAAAGTVPPFNFGVFGTIAWTVLLGVGTGVFRLL